MCIATGIPLGPEGDDGDEAITIFPSSHDGLDDLYKKVREIRY